MTEKTWFITGASRGFGREWTLAALDRGDRVAATARDIATMKDLRDKYGDRIVALTLDVRDRAACFAAVDEAQARLGRLDVVVNNAGYGQFGMIEELSEKELRDQLETNLFGAMWVTQAALPHLRSQKGGHVVQVSSVGGITAFPSFGAYHASKWALEGFTQALAQEVAGFGIRVTLIEPGSFATDWGVGSAQHTRPIAAYAGLRERIEAYRSAMPGKPGDTKASAGALLKIVDADEPPLRVFFGPAPLAMVKADYARRLEGWEKWQPLAIEAQGA